MTSARVVLCSAPPAEADTLAQALLERRLVACATVLPGATSHYRWEGRVERANESLLILKTTGDALDALIDAIHELHSYDTPEVLALPVDAGSERYLAWLSGEVAPRSPDQ